MGSLGCRGFHLVLASFLLGIAVETLGQRGAPMLAVKMGLGPQRAPGTSHLATPHPRELWGRELENSLFSPVLPSCRWAMTNAESWRQGQDEDLCLQMPSQGLRPPAQAARQALASDLAGLTEPAPERSSQASEDSHATCRTQCKRKIWGPYSEQLRISR